MEGRPSNGGDRKGKQEILQQLAWIPQDYEEFKIDIHEILASDLHTVTLLSLRSKRHGKVYEDKQAHVAHLTDDGRLKELWIISDTEQLKTSLDN